MATPHNRVMQKGTDSDLLVLARLYLDNERSFIVRRCVQRFEAGEISAREAVQRSLDGIDSTGANLTRCGPPPVDMGAVAPPCGE